MFIGELYILSSTRVIPAIKRRRTQYKIKQKINLPKLGIWGPLFFYLRLVQPKDTETDVRSSKNNAKESLFNPLAYTNGCEPV
jgi:hypothetical protein